MQNNKSISEMVEIEKRCTRATHLCYTQYALTVENRELANVITSVSENRFAPSTLLLATHYVFFFFW